MATVPKVLILFASILSLVSCGGSSSGDGIPSFIGDYRFSDLSLIQDSCQVGLPDSLSDTTVVRINQVDETLGLTIGRTHLGFLPRINSQGLNGVRRELSFLGTLDRERIGFTVRSAEFQDDECVSQYSFDFDITSKTGADFDILFLFEVICPNRSCIGSYEGTASKRHSSRISGHRTY
jgi:hypothetical protein